jgi:hypothetical protein
MFENNTSVAIELCLVENVECLKFNFNGHLKTEDALIAIDEWKSLFESSTDEKITIIWDCIHMTGFDNKARIAWQNAIKDLKSRFECVWLVTDNKIIKAGAKLMNTFTSFKMKVVKSLENIIFPKSNQLSIA